MSARLTKDIRDAITSAVLIHRFEQDVEALVVERAVLADDVYNDFYKRSDREKMDALPDGWLVTVESIGVQFGGSYGYSTLYFSGSVYGDLSSVRKRIEREKPTRRILAKNNNRCMKVYEGSHRLSEKHSEIEAKQKSLLDAVRIAKSQIEGALSKVSTIKRLIEAWPEVEPFARKYEAAAPKLPSVPTDQLNKLLDLPVAA